MNNPIGLIQKIREATTLEDIGLLEARGSGFKNASDKTKRKWREAAELRRNQLTTN